VHHAAFVIENEFRGLDKITLFVPPGTNGVPLLSADAVSNRKGQVRTYFFGFFQDVVACRDNRGTEFCERIKSFGVAV
jgi:hypothetical protein